MKEFLTELDITADVLEDREVQFDHHVHGGIRTDRCDTLETREFLEGVPRSYLQLGFHGAQVRVRDLFQNLGQGCLHQRGRVQLDHRMLVQVVYHLVEVPTIIIDNGPA